MLFVFRKTVTHRSSQEDRQRLTAEDIERRAYAFALDAVTSAPGVTTNQNGAFGGLASVRIRGNTSGQTLVILDGVPFGDPTGVDGRI